MMSLSKSYARLDEIEARQVHVVHPSGRPEPAEFLVGGIPEGYQFDGDVMVRVAAKNHARRAIRRLEGGSNSYRNVSIRRAFYHFLLQLAAAFWFPDAKTISYLASVVTTTLLFLAATFSLLISAVLISKGAILWAIFSALCVYGFGTLGHIQLIMHRRLHRAMSDG